MFTFSQYRELCRAASLSLDLDDLDRLGDEGYLEKDGIRIALFFDEDIVADRLFCYVDLGPIAEANRLVVFERLLTLNLLSGTKTSGVYTLDPASGNAIFCIHLMNPESMDGAGLAGILNSCIQQALELQGTLLNDTATVSLLDMADQLFGEHAVASATELV